MNTLEVWIEVPETNGQYQVSNFGHIRLMYRRAKTRRCGIPPSFACEERMLFCDFKSRRLGWLIRDAKSKSKWRFVPRDETMSIFVAGGIPIEVDNSHDDEAVRRMEDANARHQAESGDGGGDNAAASSE